MNVQELIKELQKYPPDMKVLGIGYESSYNDIEDVEIVNLRHTPDKAWYDGAYQPLYSSDTEKGYVTSDYLTLS